MQAHPSPSTAVLGVVVFTLQLLLLLTSTNSLTHPPTIAPTTSPKAPSATSTLDPKQLQALQSLSIPTSKDPCATPSLHNATQCDRATPFRHLITLNLQNCSDDVVLTFTALKSLSTLTTLSFQNCPSLTPVHLPAALSASLRSFSSAGSFNHHHLTGVWLSRLQNLTDLSLSHSPINASGPSIFLSNMKQLRTVSITSCNLTGLLLPNHLHPSLTIVDFSNNNLHGKIPSSLNLLSNLESLNLSSNQLNGTVPASISDLISLKNLTLSSNRLSGPIPDTISGLKSLTHLDLSSNSLNGTVPGSLTEMKSLKYLDLSSNNFHGVMPFNGSFIKRLAVFKIGQNSDLCYNHSSVSGKVKLGIAVCDKHGRPVSPPPAKEEDGGGSGGGVSEDDYGDEDEGKRGGHHGPNKVVLGVAIALSSIVFLIVFLILISRKCT